MPVEHRILQGEGAGRWLGYARSKVKRLAAECKRSRAPSRTKHLVVDAGMVDITVRVQGEQHYIKIERKTCPPLLSGLCDLVLHKEGDVLGATVPFTPVYQVDDPNNPDPAVTIDVFRRFYPSPAQTEPPRAWRDEPGLAGSQTAAKQIITLKASMFSGEMRKVAQVLQGMNLVVPYSPTFSKTHGVFKASNGARWVIEVSNQGIGAWPMRMCRNPIRNAAGEVVLDYTPIATPKPADEEIPAAILAGTYVQLVTAAAMQEFYSKTFFFPYCGWAFNPNGHSAANVCVHFDGACTNSFMYQILITEGDARPVSASLGIIDSGQLHGSPAVGAHIKYPNGDNRRLISFDPGELLPCPGPSEAPVYCYYDGNELFKVRYHFGQGAGTVVTDTIADLCYSESAGGTYEDSVAAYIATAGFSIGDEAPPPSDVSTTISSKIILGGSRFVGATNLTQAWDQRWNRVVGLDQTELSDTSATLSYRSVVVVPLHDREAIYYFIETRAAHAASAYIISSFICSESVSRETQQLTVCNGAGVDTTELLLADFSTHPAFVSQFRFCPNGSIQASCDPGPGCASADNVFFPIRPGADIGAVIVSRNTAACGAPFITIPHPHQQCGVFGPVISLTPRWEYHASGIPRRALSAPLNPEQLLRKIVGEDQVMFSERDAFDAGQYIISPEVNLYSGSAWLSTAGNYPVAETGPFINFIGVP